MRKKEFFFILSILLCLLGCSQVENDEHLTEEVDTIGQMVESPKEIEQLLLSYYKEYALFGDETSEILEVVIGSEGEVYLRMKDGCYEELLEKLETANEAELTEKTTKVSIHRADKEVLSLLKVSYSDDGEISYISHNYDVVSGRELELTDVVTDIGIVKEVICEQMGKSNLEEEDLQVWTIGYEGMTIYLQTDTEKAIAVFVPYEKFPNLFIDRLKQTPTGYAVGFDEYSDLMLDVDGDGTPDTIQMEMKKDENGSTSEVIVRIGDKEINCPMSFCAEKDSTGGYFVQNNDGKKYIYVYTNTELDYCNLYNIIQVDEKGLIYVGNSVFNFDMAHAITNPEKIYEAKECQTKGFGFDMCYAYVNAEGYIEEKDQTVYCGTLYTTSEIMKGKRVDPKGGTLQKEIVTIPSGEIIILFRTDYSEYKEYILADGSICRVDY